GGEVFGFAAKVELLAKVAGEAVGQPCDTDPAGPFGALLGAPGGARQDGQVPLDQRVHPGRWTLTTTSSPDASTTPWTSASDAAASGTSSKRANNRSIGLASSRSTVCLTSGTATAVTWSCRLDSSVARAGGSKSARVESTWPNLTKMPPASSSASLTALARACGERPRLPRPPAAGPRRWRNARRVSCR